MRHRQTEITRQWSEWKTLKDAIAPAPSANSIELRLKSLSSSKEIRMLSSFESVSNAQPLLRDGQLTLQKLVPRVIQLGARIAGKGIASNFGLEWANFLLNTPSGWHWKTVNLPTLGLSLQQGRHAWNQF